MAVWRDTWHGDPQVLVIAPGPPAGGVIRQAIVMLDEAQTEPVVTLRDSLNQTITVELPGTLLDGESRNVESNCTLKLRQT